MSDVQALIARKNAEADRARGKAVGKRFSGLRLREEKVLLLLAELRRFEAVTTFSSKDLQSWRKVQPLLKMMEREMEGKG